LNEWHSAENKETGGNKMRSVLALALLTIVASGSVFAQDLETEQSKLSYSVGWDLARDLTRRSTEFDFDSLIAAIRDVAGEQEPKIAVEEMQALLTALQQQYRQEQVEAFQALAAENQVKSDAFLESNKTKKNIVVMESGVQYRIIEEGEGSYPVMEDVVRLHYRGSMADGREFDSSFARGVPEEIAVNAALQGWQEVLPLMKQGATWQVFIPPELAFGPRGNPPVGPNEALMFDLKLVEIIQ
jgi:FKBP-type peptidyl-prolyl cis-trans isomerase FklB